MGIFRGIGRMLKPLVDIPKWIDAKRITSDANYLGRVIKNIFVPRKAERKESLKQAMQRLNLTEKDLESRYQEFHRLFLIFCGITLLLCIYMVYLYATLSFRAALLTTVISGISLAQVFRYHFWMYQLKKRKLGCSLKEWFWVGVLGRKS